MEVVFSGRGSYGWQLVVLRWSLAANRSLGWGKRWRQQQAGPGRSREAIGRRKREAKEEEEEEEEEESALAWLIFFFDLSCFIWLIFIYKKVAFC